jgi:low affinity Fe/Cu permease
MRRLLTWLGAMSAHPSAFAVVAIYALLWIVLDPASLNWHGVATLATWLMTLFIQRAEHRETQAIHAKLDELLRAEGHARTELTRIDERQPEEIERHRRRRTAADGGR